MGLCLSLNGIQFTPVGRLVGSLSSEETAQPYCTTARNFKTHLWILCQLDDPEPKCTTETRLDIKVNLQKATNENHSRQRKKKT